MAQTRKKSAIGASSLSRQIERVAMYLRVSTEDQARSGLGIDAQRSRCLAMATVKGWPTPLEYADEGISGTKDSTKRPQLQRMLGDVASGHLDAVIILSLDRLGRKTRLILALVDDLTHYGVALVSCKESLDTTTPQGQFVLTLFAGLAQLERDVIAERTRAALAEHSRRDGESGGRMPYGYARDGQSIRVEREASRIVRRIFALRSQGLTLRAIAAQLNKRTTLSPRGKRWHHSSVAVVLANEEAYRGGLRGASAIKWPVILKDEGLDTHDSVE